MEHEIFNNDDEEIVDIKNTSKQINITLLNYILIVASLFFVFVNRFVQILSPNNVVYAVFFFISFGCALGAFVLTLINKLKFNIDNKFQMILSMFAIVVSIL